MLVVSFFQTSAHLPIFLKTFLCKPDFVSNLSYFLKCFGEIVLVLLFSSLFVINEASKISMALYFGNKLIFGIQYMMAVSLTLFTLFLGLLPCLHLQEISNIWIVLFIEFYLLSQMTFHLNSFSYCHFGLSF